VNTRLLKIVGAVAFGFVLAFAGGWVWGASGRVELQSRLKQTDLRLQIAEARGRLLAARVDLYTLNFGAAAQNLESAKAPLEAVIGSYERDGESVRVTHARAALAAAEEARTLAARVDQSAQGAAARALAAFERATGPAK
jgi:exonuclease VII small subunit